MAKKFVKLIFAVVMALVVIWGFVFTKPNFPASSEPAPGAPAIIRTRTSGKLGVQYISDLNGRSLYINKKEYNKTSECYVDCERQWLPFLVDPSGQQLAHNFEDRLNRKLNTFQRRDGKLQYAVGSQPLYYYFKDENPGDINGHLLEAGTWSVAWAW